MSGEGSKSAGSWSEAWWDLLAFALGLALAWLLGWETTDLVWSLWLSSLVVGYALIVWNLSAALREFGANAAADRSSSPGAKAGGLALLLVGFLFGLAFFTVHFGGFHFVHSVFLNVFFPVDSNPAAGRGFPSWRLYADVVRRYWVFVPLAFVAERMAFRSRRPEKPDLAVTPEAIARRKAASGGDMMAPYKNVIRMHLLIFFFAAVHYVHWENFVVYAVVYAAYFFPWRVLRRKDSEPAAAG